MKTIYVIVGIACEHEDEVRWNVVAFDDVKKAEMLSESLNVEALKVAQAVQELKAPAVSSWSDPIAYKQYMRDLMEYVDALNELFKKIPTPQRWVPSRYVTVSYSVEPLELKKSWL